MSTHPPLATAQQIAADSSTDADERTLRLVTSGNPEHKTATVMFVDIKESMLLINSIELDKWWSVIASLFELMCEGVYQFGGWVGNFTGDGIEAVFEASDASGTHARRACEAALWMRDAIGMTAEKLRREQGIEIAVRIGINSGEVLIGTIGDRYNRYYTANGYAVCLAKRMEVLAVPNRIFLTEHTAALVAGALAVRNVGAFEVKGADLPVGVFELVGGRARTAPTGDGAEDRRQMAPPQRTRSRQETFYPTQQLFTDWRNWA
jgi:class 3 adenylate cyclase